MVLGRVDAPTERCTQHERAAQASARPRPHSRRVVHQLIDGSVDEAHELDFRHGPKPLHREPDGDAGNAGLGERGIENAVWPESLQQAVRCPEHTAYDTHVLAQNQHAVVLGHGAAQRQVHRLEQRVLSHRRGFL